MIVSISIFERSRNDLDLDLEMLKAESRTSLKTLHKNRPKARAVMHVEVH